MHRQMHYFALPNMCYIRYKKMEKHFNLIKMHSYYISKIPISQYPNFKKYVKFSIFIRKNSQN